MDRSTATGGAFVDRFRAFHRRAIERLAAPYSPDDDRLMFWRASILFSMLLTGLVLCLFAGAAGLTLAITEGAWQLVVFDLLGYIVGIALFFAPGIRYEIRALTTLIMCYAVGMAVILAVGLLSGGPAWLFAFAVLVGVLLGAKPAILAIALNAASLSACSWLVATGRLGGDMPSFKTFQAMVAAGVNFIVLNAIAAFSVAALVKGLVATYEQEKALARRLAHERSQLLDAKRDLEQEVAERRQTARALAESEERYRSFVDNAPMAMYTINARGEFTYGNKKLLALTGYRRDDWLDKPFHPIVHPDDLGIVLEKIQQRLEGGGSTDPYELRIFHASGDVMWVEIVSESLTAPTPDGGKELVGMQSFVTNITQRKNAEKALRESEERYRHLFEMESDAIFLIAKDTGEFLEVNESAVDLYGYSRAELLTMTNLDLSAEPEKSRRTAQEEYTRVPLRYHRKKDGSVFPVEITASHLTWSGREGHIAAVRDSSLRIAAEKQRMRLERDLFQARKMESIGTLAGGVAHDFNNILYMIIGNAELALEDIPQWNPLHKNIESIKSAGLRAAGIVKQLLSFSHQAHQELQPIEILAVIIDAIAFLRSTIPATIDIRRRLPSEPVTILADPIQINQVLMNICVNASQAMEKTGGVLNIDVQTRALDEQAVVSSAGLKPGEYLQIRLSDTGPGIPSDIIGRVFDPYFTTKPVGEGSGMGLAVVHGIVKHHGGSISVESPGGEGATFTLLFPVVDEPAAVPDPVAADVSPGSESILFVDDEKAIARMTGLILQRLGYTVDAYTDPGEALRVFTANPDGYDVVITDMTMPEMTGIQLFEALKAVRPNLPVIVCTGHSALIDAQKAEALGLAALVMKPIVKREIADTIRKVLDRRQRTGRR